MAPVLKPDLAGEARDIAAGVRALARRLDTLVKRAPARLKRDFDQFEAIGEETARRLEAVAARFETEER